MSSYTDPRITLTDARRYRSQIEAAIELSVGAPLPKHLEVYLDIADFGYRILILKTRYKAEGNPLEQEVTFRLKPYFWEKLVELDFRTLLPVIYEQIMERIHQSLIYPELSGGSKLIY